MRYLRSGRATDDEVASDVDVRVVVDQLRAGVGAGGASETGVQRDTVILVVPSVVDDIQLVSSGEQADRAGIIAQVASVALVHLPLVTSSHAPHD